MDDFIKHNFLAFGHIGVIISYNHFFFSYEMEWGSVYLLEQSRDMVTLQQQKVMPIMARVVISVLLLLLFW